MIQLPVPKPEVMARREEILSALRAIVPGGPLEYADYELPAISWVLVFVPMAAAAFTLAIALRVRASRRGALAESAA